MSKTFRAWFTVLSIYLLMTLGAFIALSMLKPQVALVAQHARSPLAVEIWRGLIFVVVGLLLGYLIYLASKGALRFLHQIVALLVSLAVLAVFFIWGRSAFYQNIQYMTVVIGFVVGGSIAAMAISQPSEPGEKSEGPGPSKIPEMRG